MALKMLYSNVNCYQNKSHLIKNIIEENGINCTAFVETKNNPNTNIKYRDWSVVTEHGNIINRNTRGGAIFQFHPGTYMRKENPPRTNNLSNNALHVSIPYLDDRLHIILVYVHNTSLIENTIFIKSKQFKYAILLGDFNPNRQKKTQIKDFLQTSNFTQVTTSPTFIMPNNRDTTPDLVFCTKNIRNNLINIEVIPDIGADHLSIILTLNTGTPVTQPPSIEKYNFNKADIEKINQEITAFLDSHADTPMTEELIENFNIKLSDIVTRNTPKNKHTFYLHELPPFIIRQIKIKRQLYREYQNNNRCNIFKAKINVFNKNIQQMIMQFKTHLWLKACEQIEQSKGRNYWQTVKKLSKYNKSNNTSSHIIENGQTLTTDTEKAEAFAQHFKKTYTTDNDPNFNAQNLRDVSNWYEDYFNLPANEHEEINNITGAEFATVLKKCKNTSPGIDNIPIGIIKKLNQRAHLFITESLNYCLKNSLFPQLWKTGVIITIPKPNTDHSKIENNRPITLLPSIGKLYERIIKSRLEEAVSAAIPIYQFGFVKGKSTLNALTTLVSNVEASKLSNKKTAALFLDIAKAFDSVWHRGLLYKLHQLQCPQHLLHTVKNFLHSRSLIVRSDSATSTSFSPQQGVPQGSPLSPLLYNIYCNDIYNSNQINKEFIDPSQYILQFADDTALISHKNNLEDTIESLQNSANNIMVWFNKWRLKPNPRKSQLIIFNHKITHQSPKIHLLNVEISPVQTAKYLGINIDNKLNFNHHLQQCKNKMTHRASHFRSITFKNQNIQVKQAAKIYKSICRPLIEYGHIILLNCKKSAIKKTKTAETSAIRRLTRIRHPANPLYNPPNTLLYNTTGITPIMTRTRELTKRFAIAQIENLQPLAIQPRQNINRKHKYPTHTTYQHLETMANE